MDITKTLLLSNLEDFDIIQVDEFDIIQERLKELVAAYKKQGYILVKIDDNLNNDGFGSIIYHFDEPDNNGYAFSLVVCDGVAENIKVINEK